MGHSDSKGLVVWEQFVSFTSDWGDPNFIQLIESSIPGTILYKKIHRTGNGKPLLPKCNIPWSCVRG